MVKKIELVKILHYLVKKWVGKKVPNWKVPKSYFLYQLRLFTIHFFPLPFLYFWKSWDLLNIIFPTLLPMGNVGSSILFYYNSTRISSTAVVNHHLRKLLANAISKLLFFFELFSPKTKRASKKQWRRFFRTTWLFYTLLPLDYFIIASFISF